MSEVSAPVNLAHGVLGSVGDQRADAMEACRGNRAEVGQPGVVRADELDEEVAVGKPVQGEGDGRVDDPDVDAVRVHVAKPGVRVVAAWEYVGVPAARGERAVDRETMRHRG